MALAHLKVLCAAWRALWHSGLSLTGDAYVPLWSASPSSSPSVFSQLPATVYGRQQTAAKDLGLLSHVGRPRISSWLLVSAWSGPALATGVVLGMNQGIEEIFPSACLLLSFMLPFK